MTANTIALLALIVGVIGCLITAGTIVYKASSAISKLEATISFLAETIKEFKKDAKDEHSELHRVQDEHTLKLEDHEGRIKYLEKKGEGK